MTSRRVFCQTLAAATLAGARSTQAQTRIAIQNVPAEWSFTSAKAYSDPFSEVDVDMVLTTPTGEEHRVPAFWAGDLAWRIRYAPPLPGAYKFRLVCSDTTNRDLHGVSGTLEAAPYTGQNALFRHGPIRVAPDKRHFQQADGTPFFWLGDTWWMGFCQRFRWPGDFETLTADRVRKGFTIVQIVAGLYPDMEPFDPRGANEAGFAWLQDFSKINPAYFDMADIRIRYLADQGLAACVVGSWGYFIPRMGVAKIKQHWRYLIARWGAYPVVWCLAGEGTMPFYLSKNKEQDAALQKHGLTELARYVRATDPAKHLITIHPSRSARDCIDDASLLDFDMLQTGHDDRRSIPSTIDSVTRSLAASPRMPVLVGEVCYEGIQEASRQEVQRFMFWNCMLSGAGGHTYGANGIWQFNTPEKPYGPSPHGHSWGGPPWNVAANLPGSGQIGLAKGLLARYSWWKLEPKLDLVEPHWTQENYIQTFAAQIEGEAIIVYSPSAWKALRFRNLPQRPYKAFFFNPVDGSEHSIETCTPSADGTWQAPEFPIFQDWVMVLQVSS